MTEENLKSTENSRSSEELQMEIKSQSEMIASFRQMQELQNEAYYRMLILQTKQQETDLLLELKEQFVSMNKTLRNFMRIYATANNIELE